MICISLIISGSVVKNLPPNAGDTGYMGSITDWEDSLEEEMATSSSTLAWKIPWTEEPGRPQSHKELGMTEQLSRHEA